MINKIRNFFNLSHTNDVPTVMSGPDALVITNKALRMQTTYLRDRVAKHPSEGWVYIFTVITAEACTGSRSAKVGLDILMRMFRDERFWNRENILHALNTTGYTATVSHRPNVADEWMDIKW